MTTNEKPSAAVLTACELNRRKAENIEMMNSHFHAGWKDEGSRMTSPYDPYIYYWIVPGTQRVFFSPKMTDEVAAGRLRPPGDAASGEPIDGK